MRNIKREAILIVVLVVGLAASAAISRWLDSRRIDHSARLAEERLYLSGPAARRLTLAFNGLAADWYWMRSLQYVGRKIVSYQDSHDGQFTLTKLSTLDLRQLASLLDIATTLDPQFISVYEYGAVILPEVDPDQAIALLNKGIAANPTSWRLHHYLGYTYWQRGEYAKAAENYAAGAKLAGAPTWMAAMSARLNADAGSRYVAGQMYQHLYDSSSDESVKQMVEAQLARLDWLDERDVLRSLIAGFKTRTGRCLSSWRELGDELRGARVEISRLSDPDNRSLKAYHPFKLNSAGEPLDPLGTPYQLTNAGCDVDLDPNSKVAR